LADLIPPPYTQEEHNLDLVSQEVHDRLSASLWTAPLLDPSRCDARFLPVLANFYSVDFWSDALSEADKRRLIASSIDLKRHAGTVWALTHALASIDVDIRLREWFDYSGDPYKFKLYIDVDDRGLNDATIEMIDRLANTHKNARSHLEAIFIYLTNHGSMHFASMVTSGETTTIYPYFPEQISINAPQYMGVSYQSVDTTVIYPQGA